MPMSERELMHIPRQQLDA